MPQLAFRLASAARDDVGQEHAGLLALRCSGPGREEQAHAARARLVTHRRPRFDSLLNTRPRRVAATTYKLLMPMLGRLLAQSHADAIGGVLRGNWTLAQSQHPAPRDAVGGTESEVAPRKPAASGKDDDGSALTDDENDDVAFTVSRGKVAVSFNFNLPEPEESLGSLLEESAGSHEESAESSWRVQRGGRRREAREASSGCG